MNEILTAFVLTSILVFSSLSGASQNTPSPNGICTIQTSIGCLDDAEITNYNVTNNNGSICKIEVFGVCSDGMNQQELEDLTIYYTENNN